MAKATSALTYHWLMAHGALLFLLGFLFRLGLFARNDGLLDLSRQLRLHSVGFARVVRIGNDITALVLP